MGGRRLELIGRYCFGFAGWWDGFNRKPLERLDVHPHSCNVWAHCSCRIQLLPMANIADLAGGTAHATSSLFYDCARRLKKLVSPPPHPHPFPQRKKKVCHPDQR